VHLIQGAQVNILATSGLLEGASFFKVHELFEVIL